MQQMGYSNGEISPVLAYYLQVTKGFDQQIKGNAHALYVHIYTSLLTKSFSCTLSAPRAN